MAESNSDEKKSKEKIENFIQARFWAGYSLVAGLLISKIWFGKTVEVEDYFIIAALCGIPYEKASHLFSKSKSNGN